MNKILHYIGLDVHKESIAVVAAARKSAANFHGNFRRRLSAESRYAKTDGASRRNRPR